MARFFRLFGLGAATLVAVLAGMVLLPHDPYIRWQAIKVEAYARLGWIFERIHFDPTPIDIAFIGTSHTMNGIDAEAFERQLSAATGSCVHAVNLAIPSYGRNLHWLLVRELLTHRQVRTLVIETFENETRKPHPLFAHVAEVADVLSAPVLININYLHDVVRLPWRQLSLWAESLSPEAWGLRRRPDLADYDGSNVDNTRVVNVGGIALTPLRDTAMAPAALEAAAAAQRADKRLHWLGPRFADWEYVLPNTYLRRILDLAHERGVEVVFLYLPGYGNPPAPVDNRLYQGAPMLTANDVLARSDAWLDVNHLNMLGAARLTSRLATLFAERGGVTAKAIAECGAGLPSRPVASAKEVPLTKTRSASNK